ncbi:MAG: MFS transporter [Bacteroidota bacterium]
MYTETLDLTLSRRTIRTAVGAFFFIMGLCFASWASRIPNIQSQLHLSDAGLGGVLFALPAGLMAGLPLSGWLVTRYGSRQIVILAAVMYASTLPFIGLVQEPWQLVGVLFMYGLWGNLGNISVNTQAVGTELLYGRSIIASFHGIWSLAGFTGAAIGALMVSLNVSPFAHFCCISVIAYLLVLVFYKNILPQDASRDSSQPLFVRPNGALLLLGLIAFCCMICEGAMFDWSGVYFHKVVQVSEQLTTLGYVAFMSTMAGGRFIGDWLVVRLGMKRLVQLNGVLIASGLLIAVFFPYLPTATVGFLLVGMGVSTVVPLVYGAAGKSKTMSAGVALAAVSSISFFGFLLGPPLIGFIAQAASLRWSFAIVAVLGFCTTILIRKVKVE